MTTDGHDPFPLLHLAPLDFPCDSEVLINLPSYRLALAPFSANWEEGLKPLLKRTLRKRREKARDQIVSKAPMGIECTAQELQEEEFPKFEMIDLSFKLDNLNSLSSSQLAAIVVHPEATEEHIQDAEDIFFRRRERDLAAGLTLHTNLIRQNPSSSDFAQTQSLPQTASPPTVPASFSSSLTTDSVDSAMSPRSPTSNPQQARETSPLLLDTTSSIANDSILSPPPPEYSSSASLTRMQDSPCSSRQDAEEEVKLEENDQQGRNLTHKDGGEQKEEEREKQRKDLEARMKGEEREWAIRAKLDLSRTEDRFALPQHLRCQDAGWGSRKRRGSPESPRRSDSSRRRRTEEVPRMDSPPVDRIRRSSAEPSVSIRIPRPYEWVPFTVLERLVTVYIAFFPPDSNEQTVLKFLDTVAPGISPVAVKLVPQFRAPPSNKSIDRQGHFYAFAAFESSSDAAKVIERGKGFRQGNSYLTLSIANKSNISGWKWGSLSQDFVLRWHQEQQNLIGSKALPVPPSRQRLLSAQVSKAPQSSAGPGTPSLPPFSTASLPLKPLGDQQSPSAVRFSTNAQPLHGPSAGTGSGAGSGYRVSTTLTVLDSSSRTPEPISTLLGTEISKSKSGIAETKSMIGETTKTKDPRRRPLSIKSTSTNGITRPLPDFLPLAHEQNLDHPQLSSKPPHEDSLSHLPFSIPVWEDNPNPSNLSSSFDACPVTLPSSSTNELTSKPSTEECERVLNFES